MAGPLLLAGGAEFDGRMADADKAVIDKLSVERARVVILPTANQDHPALAAANGVAHFLTLGVDAIDVQITDKSSAEDERLVAKLAEADFVYMAGGNPLYLLETLKASAALETMLRRWRDGMALGGSSAGAMVLCQVVFVQQQWADGWGILPGTVTLPHFNQRDEAWAERARQAVTARGLTGLAIDESTACLWLDGQWQAVGPGRVQLLTSSGIRAFESGKAIEGLAQPKV